MEDKRQTDLSDNDEDSGNDEPPYNLARSYDHDPRFLHFLNGPFRRLASADSDDASVSQSKEDAAKDSIANSKNIFSGNRPLPEPPRNLRHYLNMLSDLRDGDEAKRLVCTPSDKKNICSLPVEVLLIIFSYLDDLSLNNVGLVCKQWRKILELHTPQEMWQKYTKERWPLYRQIIPVPNWFNVSQLINRPSFNCLTIPFLIDLLIAFVIMLLPDMFDPNVTQDTISANQSFPHNAIAWGHSHSGC